MNAAAQATSAVLPPFATPADLALYTKGAVAADDPNAQTILDAVSAMIRRYCGWHIYPNLELQLTMDCDGGVEFSLPSKHVTDLFAIIDRRTVTAFEAELYEWSRLGQVRMVRSKSPNCTPSSWAHWNSGWPRGYRNLDVAFNSGYDEAPPELLMLTLTVAARVLSSPSGATREQAGQVSVSYATVASGVAGGMSLLGSERELLDVYRIVGA